MNRIGCGRGIGGCLRHSLQGENFIRHIGNDKLIFDFKENGGTVLRDKSHNNNNGVFGAGAVAPTWIRDGLSFDGASQVVIADNVDIRFGTGDFTIIMQIANYMAADGTFLSKGRTGAAEWWLWDNDGNLRWYSNGSTMSMISSGITIRDDSKHHIVIRRKGSLGNMFFDGIDIKRDVTSSCDLSTDKVIYIGRSLSGGDFCTATISYILICKKALSQIEIQQNYLANKFRSDN